MYLALLSKEEKELFLGLAHHLAASDGEYSAEEKDTIAGYCYEMELEFQQETLVKPLEEILSQFNDISGDKVKKIIIFEAIGLAMADNNYDQNEKKLVMHMEKIFGLKQGFGIECEHILEDYIKFQNNINQMILG